LDDKFPDYDLGDIDDEPMYYHQLITNRRPKMYKILLISRIY